MSEKTEKTEAEKAAEQLEALKAKRASKEKSLADLRVIQELKDEQAIESYREQYGEQLSVVVINAWVPGTPTKAAARPASRGEIKRHQDSVKVSIKDRETTVKGSADAAVLLARGCALYPVDGPDLEAMAERYPGFLQQLGQEIISKAQAKSEDDAKS